MPRNERPSRAVVAIIRRSEKFLGIKRSESVIAPGAVCFPGGGIDDGESEPEALIREIREELGVSICPVNKVWESVTPWGVQVSWFVAEIKSGHLVIDESEVAECFWWTKEEFQSSNSLLESNAEFFSALDAGEIDLD